MANTTKNLTYPLLHLCSLLFSTCTFIFIFFKGRRKRINNPKRITNQEWIDASNLGWPFVPPPVVNLCLLQLLGWGYLKRPGNKKKVEKNTYATKCMLMYAKKFWAAGVSRDREDKEVIKNRIFYWLQQFRARPCHSLALILGKFPHALAHWEWRCFFLPLLFYLVCLDCRLCRAETISWSLQPLKDLTGACGQYTGFNQNKQNEAMFPGLYHKNVKPKVKNKNLFFS